MITPVSDYSYENTRKKTLTIIKFNKNMSDYMVYWREWSDGATSLSHVENYRSQQTKADKTSHWN